MGLSWPQTPIPEPRKKSPRGVVNTRRKTIKTFSGALHVGALNPEVLEDLEGFSEV